MNPPTYSIVGITNPKEGAAQAATDVLASVADPASIISDYGDQIENGALVSITDRDGNGNTVGQYLYIADRESNEDTLILRNNATLGDLSVFLYEAGGEVARGESAPEAELETFTVFGNNDDGEDFVAVVTATEDTVADVGVQAGLVDEGFEGSVSISLILKGDHSDTEVVAAA